jgi:hypothetical protein
LDVGGVRYVRGYVGAFREFLPLRRVERDARSVNIASLRDIADDD